MLTEKFIRHAQVLNVCPSGHIYQRFTVLLLCYSKNINVKKLVSLQHGVRAINQTEKTQITFARTLDRTLWLPLQIRVTYVTPFLLLWPPSSFNDTLLLVL